MKRRTFIAALGGAAAWPLVARAQQSGRIRRIGVLMAESENDPESQARVSAFQQRFATLGWSVGRTIQIDYRWADGDFRPTPYELNGLYQTAGIIEKDAPDGVKEHRFVRADTHQNMDDAINFTISKAKQIIDMQGDRMFV